jgi:hypothetical protein
MGGKVARIGGLLDFAQSMTRMLALVIGVLAAVLSGSIWYQNVDSPLNRLIWREIYQRTPTEGVALPA